MAKPRILSIAASAGADTAWIPLNRHQSPFAVGFGVYVSGAGEATVQVQHTFNDVMRGEDAEVFSHEDVSAATVSETGVNTVDGNYAFPIAATRLHITSVSGSSTVYYAVNQAGF